MHGGVTDRRPPRPAGPAPPRTSSGTCGKGGGDGCDTTPRLILLGWLEGTAATVGRRGGGGAAPEGLLCDDGAGLEGPGDTPVLQLWQRRTEGGGGRGTGDREGGGDGQVGRERGGVATPSRNFPNESSTGAPTDCMRGSDGRNTAPTPFFFSAPIHITFLLIKIQSSTAMRISLTAAPDSQRVGRIPDAGSWSAIDVGPRFRRLPSPLAQASLL